MELGGCSGGSLGAMVVGGCMGMGVLGGGECLWGDTHPPPRNWRWGQPDEGGRGEDCVAMDPRGGWGDRPCASSPGGWVCERPWAC